MPTVEQARRLRDAFYDFKKAVESGADFSAERETLKAAGSPELAAALDHGPGADGTEVWLQEIQRRAWAATEFWGHEAVWVEGLETAEQAEERWRQMLDAGLKEASEKALDRLEAQQRQDGGE